MPIHDVQVRMRELGRIRTGNQVVSSDGKRRRPAKLETFRITSASRDLIDAAAEAYGGEVQPWASPTGDQWEVITKADALPIVIPPGEALSQWYELWSGGGCQRRCDGRTEFVTESPCGELSTRLDGGKVIPGCPADPADRRDAAQAGEACKPTTRLGVMLPELPDLGIWRLESHGFYAAVELAGAARFLAIASASGLNIPARLRLDQREKKVPGKPTNKYAVPVIEFTTMRITDLLAASRTGTPLALDGNGASPQLGAGDVVEPPTERPAPSSPEQARKQKTSRPPLGQAPGVPDGSNFRKPSAPPPAAPPPAATSPDPAPAAGEPAPPPSPVSVAASEGESLGGWAIEDPAPAPKASTIHPLTEQIRAAINVREDEGMMTPEQKRAVFETVMQPAGATAFRVVVTDAIGAEAFEKPSAKEAAGILEVAATFVDPAELAQVWKSAAATIGKAAG